MAIGDFRLTNARYVRPGTYIGYVRIPRPTADPGNPRYPCYVGRGSRLALVLNMPHRRSYVEDEELNFSSTAPYIAPLSYAAVDDQTEAFLYKQNREVVPTDKWQFTESTPGSGVYDQVEIQVTEFDKNATYLIDYQSSERDDILDPLGFNELRQMGNVGDSEGQNKYQEFVDYRIVTEIVGNASGGDPDALIPGSSNSHLTGRNLAVVKSAGTGVGTVAHATTSQYTYDYGMQYTLYCRAFTAAVDATFELVIVPVSGGNSQVNKVPEYGAFVGTGAIPAGRSIEFTVAAGTPTTVQLDTAASYGYNDAIVLDFDFTAGDFNTDDVFTWDSYGPGMIELSSAHDNTNQFAETTEPVEGSNYLTAAAATDSGSITMNPNAEYTGTMDRHYKMQVYYPPVGPTGDGPSGNRRFNIIWSAYDELPYTEGVIAVDEATPTSLTNQHLENGIYVDINLGAGHALADTTNIITAADANSLATALTLCADAQTQHDAHDNNGGGVYHPAGAGSHQTTVAAPTNEAELVAATQELQTLYTAHIGDNLMHIPVDDIWALASAAITDTATAAAFLNDFKAKFNRHRQAFNFVEGDTWSFVARAPRQDYTDKDDRLYTLTVGNVVTTNGSESITVAWYTDTYEGGFGNFTVPYNDIYVDLPDSITMAFRNFPTIDPAQEQFATNDIFTFTTVNEDEVDWSLRTRANETIPEDEIFQDTLGRVTGTPLAYYIILSDVPETVYWVKKVSDGSLVSYTQVYDAGNPTVYLSFATDPGDDLQIYYEHRGEEPSPGSIYYISAQRLRLDSEYETPIRYLNRDDMERGLGPKSTDNQLWIAGDIAFDTDFFGAYFVQVKDAAGNQVFSTADFRRAIDATETKKDITDLIIIDFFPALAYSKSSIEKMADPFENAERMLWVGVPIGTPLGDEDTPDSLIYLAKKTLQFQGDNPGRGHVVLVANDSAERTVVLDDGTSTRVTLDGSFIAGFSAARNAAFRDPAQTLLRKDCTSFEDMNTFNEQEELILGGASILYLSDVGGGVFRYNESQTVDTSAPDLQEISAMNQKIYVTRKVARDMDDALISIVPPSPASGVAIVRAFLSDELAAIVSSGVIAPYGSETNPPTVRQINSSSDIYVFVDERDRRLYHFGYFYNIRYPIKRLFGLFSVDTRFWDNRQ